MYEVRNVEIPRSRNIPMNASGISQIGNVELTTKPLSVRVFITAGNIGSVAAVMIMPRKANARRWRNGASKRNRRSRWGGIFMV